MLVSPSYGLVDLLQEPCRFVLPSLLDSLLVLILQGTALFSLGFRRRCTSPLLMRQSLLAAAVSGLSGSATAVLGKKHSVAPISSSSHAWIQVEVFRDPFKHPLSLRRVHANGLLQGGGVMLQRLDLRAGQIPVANRCDGGLCGAMPTLLPASQREIKQR